MIKYVINKGGFRETNGGGGYPNPTKTDSKDLATYAKDTTCKIVIDSKVRSKVCITSNACQVMLTTCKVLYPGSNAVIKLCTQGWL